MARDYLTKDERMDVLTAYIGIAAAKTYLDRAYAIMGKEERKYLKMSVSFFDKFESEMAKRIKQSEFEKMIRELKGATVELRRTGAYTKADFQITFEDVHDMSAALMEGQCRGCHLEGTMAGQCSLLKLFRQTQVPVESGEYCPEPAKVIQVLDPTTVQKFDCFDGYCPYRLEPIPAPCRVR